MTRPGALTRALTLLLLMLLPACEAPADRPLLAARGPSWPSPPDTPRIRYLGELRGESTLGRRVSGGAALRELLTGPPPANDFVGPTAVAVHEQLVFVTDARGAAGAALHRLDLATRQIASVSQAGGAALQAPVDIAIVGGRAVVVDAKRAALLAFDLDGSFERELGAGLFQRPASIAHDAASQALLVSDSAAHEIVVLDLAGGPRARLGGRGAQPGRFNYPAGVAVSAELLLVADAMNFRVQVLEHSGTPRFSFGQKGDGAGDFALPRDLAVDSDGNLYVLDSQFENVQVFDRAGRLLLAFGEEGRGPGQFNLPAGICIDRQDRIWIADTYNQRVQVFQYLRETPS